MERSEWGLNYDLFVKYVVYNCNVFMAFFLKV